MATSNGSGRPIRKNRRGRPEGESFARERIMDAAELTFAAHGYTRASLRLIVEKAHVTQALITYYFGSKEQLFKEVFIRRGREMALCLHTARLRDAPLAREENCPKPPAL